MAKGHRSKIKRERNAQKDLRPRAKVSFARIAPSKAKIVLDTIKGKDVSFMENQVGWHGTAPNAEQYETAMNDLNKVLAGLEAE